MSILLEGIFAEFPLTVSILHEREAFYQLRFNQLSSCFVLPRSADGSVSEHAFRLPVLLQKRPQTKCLRPSYA
jgi:hypothetical protein